MLGANSYPRRGRFGASILAAPSASGSNTFLVRPRLPLRSYSRPKTTANALCVDSTGYGRSKRLKSRKLNGYQKIDGPKKKSPDYTEVAYREAVSKLKYLLAESYTPRITPRKLLHGGGKYFDSNPKINVESADDTDERSIISDGSQNRGLIGNLSPKSSPYISRPKNSQLSKAYSNLAMLAKDSQSAPPELMSFIERQEEYIEQLERESSYCRDELSNLLGKVREVVAENEALHDKNKNGYLKSVREEYNNSGEENQEPNDNDARNIMSESKGKRVKLHKVLEGPSIVFESRISELEAQLTQARVELRKVREENQSNLKRFSDNGNSIDSPELKAQLEKALRDKCEAESKIEEMHKNLTSLRDRESDTAHKAKRALDVLEQAQFEKTQAEAEMRRLRDELERQHERLREVTQETSRRLAEERHQLERRYSQQVEQLSADVASHWDAASKSQLEAEKQRREMSELRRDLAQKQAHIDELKKELQSKISSMQSDVNRAIAEKDAAEEEISAAKLSMERAERQARQEQNRLQSEINSYKQRLERADADLVHCRRENLRLTEQISSLEKEINLNKMVHADDRATVATPRGDNDKELTSMIMDLESKHEGLAESDEGAIVASASHPNKKRTIKVDLKVKVVPKKKSGRAESSKTPLSAQEEMASLQDNLKYITTRLHDSLVQQNGTEQVQPPSAGLEYSDNISESIENPESQNLSVSLEKPRTSEAIRPSSDAVNGSRMHTSISDHRTNPVTDTPQSENRRKQEQDTHFANQNAYLPNNKTSKDYAPESELEHYSSEDQKVEPHGIQNDSTYEHFTPDTGLQQENYNLTNNEEYAMENYPVDTENYQQEFTDQDYQQYNQYNQEQYAPEHYVEGEQYENQEMYQHQEPLTEHEKYTDYPNTNYEGDNEQFHQQSEEFSETQMPSAARVNPKLSSNTINE